ncbi:MAG: hypothetical protein QOJ51_56 [Acidobacteriaceae bacterium]|nr:hypothetical protein [Acidobacteriaceae bacterium]
MQLCLWDTQYIDFSASILAEAQASSIGDKTGRVTN